MSRGAKRQRPRKRDREKERKMERLDKSSRISRQADEAEATGGKVATEDHSSPGQATVSKAAMLPAHPGQEGGGMRREA